MLHNQHATNASRSRTTDAVGARRFRSTLPNTLLALLAIAPLLAVAALTVNTSAAFASTPFPASCIYTPTDFANAFLDAIPEPDTPSNVEAILAWEEDEGGNWENTAMFNPLDTTQPYDNSVNFDSIAPYNGSPNAPGVQAFSDWSDGVTATVITIENGYYPNILAALAEGNDALAVITAVANSPWGSFQNLGNPNANPPVPQTPFTTAQLQAYLPPNYDPSAPSWESPSACTPVDTSGDAWVTPGTTSGTTSGTTTASQASDPNYCRAVGAGPDWVDSFVTCTAFDGTSFGPTVTSGVLDWGYDTARSWVPGPDGSIDYCRQVGKGPDLVASYLACTPFDGTKFGPTVTSGIEDWGFLNGTEQWVPGPHGTIDYCRQVGTGPNMVASYLACTPFDGTSFGATVISGLVNWGYLNSAAQWVPGPDGTVDFCRQNSYSNYGIDTYVECTPFNGTKFGATVESGVLNWGRENGSAAWLPMSNGDIDYCNQVGAGPNLVSSYLSCTPFNGTSFGATVTSQVVDWGYRIARSWVAGPNGTADYCRRVGQLPPSTDTYVACTTFDGTSFAPTVVSPAIDWGYDPGASWAPSGNGAQYCSWTGAVTLTCTLYDGSSFEKPVSSGMVSSQVQSPVVQWGFDT